VLPQGDLIEPEVTKPRYARFSRRLRAIVIDWVVLAFVAVAALVAATTVRSDGFSRALGLAVVLVLVLYEPLLVWLTGGTIGHNLSNLRVVDDRTQGNVSFPKAVARFIIKTVLGWFSFLIIEATRRSQAMHDLATRSTVQIRDPAKASPHHYVDERVELSRPEMPSRLRRSAVIVVYLLGLLLVFSFALVGLEALHLVSANCARGGACTDGEHLLMIVLTLIWLGTSGLCIGMGWRGRLLGGRARSAST
jgi:uncharacterized RDD family membrane protein YckC